MSERIYIYSQSALTPEMLEGTDYDAKDIFDALDDLEEAAIIDRQHREKMDKLDWMEVQQERAIIRAQIILREREVILEKMYQQMAGSDYASMPDVRVETAGDDYWFRIHVICEASYWEQEDEVPLTLYHRITLRWDDCQSTSPASIYRDYN